jgi:hypothetical protein
MPSHPRSALSWLACCLSALLSTSASAHAPAEVIEVVSDAPNDVVISTNRGLIFGSLEAGGLRLLCNEALDVSTFRPYRTALLPSGRLLIGDSGGLRYSDDRGCAFRPVEPLMGLSTPDFAHDPTQPARIFVATAGPGQNAVRVSDDEGATFRTLLTGSEDDFFGSMLLVPTTPVQLYVSLIVLDAEGNYSYALARSVDAGVSWTRVPVVLEESERDLTLLAANPARPDELLARATNVEPAQGERLLWSRDGGKSFSSPVSLRVLRAGAFSPDGQLAYAGGVDGLWQARDAARTFVQVPATARVSALETVENRLLAGAYYRGLDAPEDGIGIAPIDEPTFARWMNFNDVAEPVSCPAPSLVDALCAPLWRDWMTENPVPTPAADAGVDAGTPDLGTSARDAGVRQAGADQDGGLGASTKPDDGGAAGRDASRAPRPGASGGCSLVAAAPGQPRVDLCVSLLALLGALALRTWRAGQRLR